MNHRPNDRHDIEAVVVPPEGTGLVLRTGAATLVADTILELEFESDYFQHEVDADGAGITCVGVQLADQSLAQMQERFRTALEDLIEETPELAGWSWRVSVVDSSPGPEHGTLIDVGVLDEEPGRLLPSGEELADSLLRDIAYERSVYADAEQCRALSIEELSTENLAELGPDERAAAVRRATALAGCLVHASVILVDQLIEDVVELHDAGDDEVVDVAGTWVLSGLPERFAARYNQLFTQEFLVAVVDLTGRLTRGWEPLACVAQELGLRLLLDRVELVAEAADVALDDGWRRHLEELLFEDLDHEVLYDPALDGIEDEAAGDQPGMASMAFDDWFIPFNDERTLPPYALGGLKAAEG